MPHNDENPKDKKSFNPYHNNAAEELVESDKALSGSEKSLWRALVKHSSAKNPHVWPSNATLAKKIGRSQRQVERLIRGLVKHRLIRRQGRIRDQGGQASSLTFFNDPGGRLATVARADIHDGPPPTSMTDPPPTSMTVPPPTSMTDELLKKNLSSKETNGFPVCECVEIDEYSKYHKHTGMNEHITKEQNGTKGAAKTAAETTPIRGRSHPPGADTDLNTRAKAEESFQRGKKLQDSNPPPQRPKHAGQEVIAEYQRTVGSAYENGTPIQQAIEAYQQVLELNPSHDRALLALGTILRTFHYQRAFKKTASYRNYTTAVEYFNRAVELNSVEEVLIQHAKLCFMRQKRVDAKNSWIRALELNPKNWEAHIGLGEFYSTQEPNKALKHFREAAYLNAPYEYEVSKRIAKLQLRLLASR